jgi:hypothetical protein
MKEHDPAVWFVLVTKMNPTKIASGLNSSTLATVRFVLLTLERVSHRRLMEREEASLLSLLRACL